MFHFFKSKAVMIGSPAKGKAIPIGEVSDPTFGEEILGKGIAVIPENGEICAPADGEISMVFDTLHAFSMVSTEGVEILVHIGLETVSLKGASFTGHAKAGDKVKKGDLVISADLNAIKEAGLDIVTPIVICNTDDFAKVEALSGKMVEPGEDILKVVLK